MGTEWLESLGADFTEAWPQETLGASVRKNHGEVPDLRGVAVALIGVPELRGGTHDVADSVRRALYPLFWGPWDLQVADLGNLIPGRDRVDTLVAVEELAVEVLQYGCIPVLLGADSDWPLGVYRAFGRLERTINACLVNNRIALGDDHVLPDRSNLLAQMLTMKPFRLFHVSHLAHQSYFVAQSVLDLAEKMIRLHGLEPQKDIAIQFSGLRPGEKLYEELLANEETTLPTHHPKILIAKTREIDTQFKEAFTALLSNENDLLEKVSIMKKIVPEFISNNSRFQTLDRAKKV
ncbi:MAG: hypothetical protein RL104_70 [Bacteroidota bacterium]